MLALKMIDMLEAASSSRRQPVVWKMRETTFRQLRRQSRHTGDVSQTERVAAFRNVQIEIGDVRNALGAELVTEPR